MTCKHEATHSYYVDEEEDGWGGTTPGHWEYTTKSTTVDIDLHRYKCTQCGLVMYYSGRAREYYEEGKKFDWIEGLKK